MTLGVKESISHCRIYTIWFSIFMTTIAILVIYFDMHTKYVLKIATHKDKPWIMVILF